MQPMSDKEFDKLFKERFVEFQVNPPESLWPAINERLGNNKRKTDFSVFWMVAASVVLVFAAGLYLFMPNKAIRLHGDDTVPVVFQVKPATPEYTEEQPLIEHPVTRKQIFTKPGVRTVKKIEAVETKGFGKTAEENPSEAVKLAGISSKIEMHEDHSLNKEPVISIPDEGDWQNASSFASDSGFRTGGRPRIKSVGDLVNLVIAKVDQREDKIIEMTNTDEGTSISGINLGVLKIKAVKNKPSEIKLNFK